MANKIKITLTSGKEAAQEIALDFFTSLLVGRSRSADIRLKESDVSGKHFEFIRSDSGCSVRNESRHGLVVDGKTIGENEIVPISVGTEIAIGQGVRIRVEELPESLGTLSESAPSAMAPGADSETAADFFDAEDSSLSVADKPTGTAAETTGRSPDAEEALTEAGDAQTRGDFEEALTEAGDGETQEMKTRAGSMEEIVERKRQLDRASAARRWKFGVAIVVVLLVLTGVWFATGSRRHVTDAEGPFLPNGELDVSEYELKNADGEAEIVVEYPRDDRMEVVVSADSNAVEVASFLGADRDVPFHLEFSRVSDVADLAYSLEDSFERRMAAESAQGVTFEVSGGRRPEGEFFENAFPGFCEIKTQHGTRFVRAEFTRTRDRQLWRGVLFHFRRGDRIYSFRREMPEQYWKRGGYRITGELSLALCAPFLRGHWDSPGRGGMVASGITDDELLVRVRRELSAERAAGWTTLSSYLDTLLIRSWNEKPILRQTALSLYRTFLLRMTRLYNERKFAFDVARRNKDEKRMKSIFLDCKAVFGIQPNDRRSTLVNDPEVWSCH